MLRFNKKPRPKPGQEGVTRESFDWRSCAPSIPRPIAFLAALKRFKQMVVSIRLKLFGHVVQTAHCVNLEDADILKAVYVPGESGEGCVQLSEQVVNIGFPGWFKIVGSHFASSVGDLVRAVFRLTPKHGPLVVIAGTRTGKSVKLKLGHYLRAARLAVN